MFINCSNHRSKDWNETQYREAEKYGKIIDIPFPIIDPRMSDQEMNDRVEYYYNSIIQYDHPVIMVQGEFVFTYRLVKRLKKNGLRVVAACSERKTIESVNEKGTTLKSSEFVFVKFRDY